MLLETVIIAEKSFPSQCHEVENTFFERWKTLIFGKRFHNRCPIFACSSIDTCCACVHVICVVFRVLKLIVVLECMCVFFVLLLPKLYPYFLFNCNILLLFLLFLSHWIVISLSLSTLCMYFPLSDSAYEIFRGNALLKCPFWPQPYLIGFLPSTITVSLPHPLNQ